MHSPFDLNHSLIRQEFTMLHKKLHGKPFVYFDNAATTQKPQAVIHAISDFYANHYATVNRSVYEFAAQATMRYVNARETVRSFIKAKHSEEVIFTKGTTESINLVASSFGKAFIQEGDEVIISEMEHHSNIVPWQIMCAERGAHLKIIPIDDNAEFRLDVFKQLLSPKTKIVSIAHIANATGTINPIEEIIALARRVGAKVMVDAAQSAAHMELDVQSMDVDFLAFSGHKLFGPTGIGVLYGKKDLLEAMPPYQSGGDMIETVTFPHTTYNSLPMKFEAGTPLIAEVIALKEAMDYIQILGKENIEKWESDLTNYALHKLKEIKNLRVIGSPKKRGPIILFTVEGIHPLDIGTMLDLKGIAVRTGHLCAQPTLTRFGLESAVRVSFAAYNSFEEIDLFIHALKEVLMMLKPEMSSY